MEILYIFYSTKPKQIIKISGQIYNVRCVNL